MPAVLAIPAVHFKPAEQLPVPAGLPVVPVSIGLPNSATPKLQATGDLVSRSEPPALHAGPAKVPCSNT